MLPEASVSALNEANIRHLAEQAGLTEREPACSRGSSSVGRSTSTTLPAAGQIVVVVLGEARHDGGRGARAMPPAKVSVALRHARGGAIFAILEGGARASSNDAAEAVEASAVHGALHGALGRIPDALGR